MTELMSEANAEQCAWCKRMFGHDKDCRSADSLEVGVKHDGQKPDYSLLPPRALEQVLDCTEATGQTRRDAARAMARYRRDDTSQHLCEAFYACLKVCGGWDPIVRVLEYGVRKYSEGNYRHVPDAKRRYTAAALRHLLAHEERDVETDELHAAHAGACVLFLLEMFA